MKNLKRTYQISNFFSITKDLEVFEIYAKVKYKFIEPRVELSYLILKLGNELGGLFNHKTIMAFFGIPYVLSNAIVRYMLNNGWVKSDGEKEIKPYSKLRDRLNTDNFYLFDLPNQEINDKVFMLTEEGKEFIKNEMPYSEKTKNMLLYLVDEIGFFLSKEDLTDETETSHKTETIPKYVFELISKINYENNTTYGLPSNTLCINTDSLKLMSKYKLNFIFRPVLESHQKIRNYIAYYKTKDKKSKKMGTNDYVSKKIVELKNLFPDVKSLVSWLNTQLKSQLIGSKLSFIRDNFRTKITLNNTKEFYKFIEDLKQNFQIDIFSDSNDFNVDLRFKITNDWFINIKTDFSPGTPDTAKFFCIIKTINNIYEETKNYRGIINIRAILNRSYDEILKSFPIKPYKQPQIEEIFQVAWERNMLWIIRSINEWKMMNNDRQNY